MWSTVLMKSSYATANFVSCAMSSQPVHLVGRKNADTEVKLHAEIHLKKKLSEKISSLNSISNLAKSD